MLSSSHIEDLIKVKRVTQSFQRNMMGIGLKHLVSVETLYAILNVYKVLSCFAFKNIFNYSIKYMYATSRLWTSCLIRNTWYVHLLSGESAADDEGSPLMQLVLPVPAEWTLKHHLAPEHGLALSSGPHYQLM